MKKLTWFAFAVVLTAGLAAGVAFGQNQAMVADVPFDFYAGSEAIPAGAYTFRVMPEGKVLRITGKEFGLYRLLIPAGHADSRCEVVFNRYPDGTHFLAEIRIPGASSHELPESRLEGEVTTDWTMQKVAINLRPAGHSR